MQPGKSPKDIFVNDLKDAAGNDVVGAKYHVIRLILTITTLHEFVQFGRDANNLSKRMAGLGSTRSQQIGAE